MRKIIFIFLTVITLSATAQNDTLWRSGGVFNLNYNNAYFSQWAGGSNNSVATNALISVFAKYKKKNFSWDNNGDFALGTSKTGTGAAYRKTDDRFNVNSKLGYDLGKNIYLSFLFDFKTQFTEGFNYNADGSRTRTSNLLAPAYIINSIGLDYKPNNDFSLYLSPVTSRTLIVRDKALSAEKAFGVDSGKTVRYEFGAYLTAKYKRVIGKNVTLATRLDLFSNYLDHPENVDFTFDVLVTFKINRFLQTSINTTLVYDDNTIVPKRYDNGTQYTGKGLQVKNIFGLGVAYKFQSFGVKK